MKQRIASNEPKKPSQKVRAEVARRFINFAQLIKRQGDEEIAAVASEWEELFRADIKTLAP